jgi:hypothetical protein
VMCVSLAGSYAGLDKSIWVIGEGSECELVDAHIFVNHRDTECRCNFHRK